METENTESTPLSVLMTGGTTGLGLVTARRLITAGYKVSAVSATADGSEQIRRTGALPVYADESRPGELQGLIRLAKADIVLHLAPMAHNEVPFVNAGWDASALVTQARAIVDAAKAVGIKFFVMGSSTLAYGDQHGEWVDETAAPHPGDNPLVKGLLDAERYALSMLPAAVLRFGYLYGADAPAFETTASQLRRGRVMISGSAVANWIHLDDAARAIEAVLETQPANEVFNIVDETPVSSAQFLNDLAHNLGLQSPGNPPGFMRGLFMPRPQMELMDTISVGCHNTKAAEGFGWTPVYEDHNKGFEQTLLTWRANEGDRR